MNYLKHYIQLIRKAQKRQVITGYKEKHHIIPKCMLTHKPKKIWNGKWNLVDLTAREHFIAHLLLVKICNKIYAHSHPFSIKMLHAANNFLDRKASKNTPYIKINNRIYEFIKTQRSLILSDIMGGKNNPFYSKKHSKKSKKLQSNWHSGKKLSEEHKKKIGIKTGSRTHTKETIKLMSKIKTGNKNPMFGKHISSEHKLKISKQVLVNGKKFDSITEATKYYNCSKFLLFKNQQVYRI